MQDRLTKSRMNWNLSLPSSIHQKDKMVYAPNSSTSNPLPAFWAQAQGNSPNSNQNSPFPSTSNPSHQDSPFGGYQSTNHHQGTPVWNSGINPLPPGNMPNQFNGSVNYGPGMYGGQSAPVPFYGYNPSYGSNPPVAPHYGNLNAQPTPQKTYSWGMSVRNFRSKFYLDAGTEVYIQVNAQSSPAMGNQEDFNESPSSSPPVVRLSGAQSNQWVKCQNSLCAITNCVQNAHSLPSWLRLFGQSRSYDERPL